jgi:hypothetical protein
MLWTSPISAERAYFLEGCLLLLVMSPELFGQQATPPPPTPLINSCGAELQSGDIYVECVGIENGVHNRQHVRLTHTGDITSWGITPDGTLLAFTRGRSNEETELSILDLRTGQTKESKPTDRRSRVDPTCGTIVLREFWTKGNTHGYKFRDLVASQELQEPPSTSDLRCNGNRHYTLRLLNYDELYLYSPQPSRLAKDVRYFNISPDGEHLAYSQGGQLCAGNRGEVQKGKASCLGMTWTAGPMVVSSDGSVLFTEETSRTCTFKTSGGEGSDPCRAVFIWKPGDANDQLVSFNDSDPHIISFDTGRHVIQLSSTWKGDN